MSFLSQRKKQLFRNVCTFCPNPDNWWLAFQKRNSKKFERPLRRNFVTLEREQRGSATFLLLLAQFRKEISTVSKKCWWERSSLYCWSHNKAWYLKQWVERGRRLTALSFSNLTTIEKGSGFTPGGNFEPPFQSEEEFFQVLAARQNGDEEKRSTETWSNAFDAQTLGQPEQVYPLHLRTW